MRASCEDRSIRPKTKARSRQAPTSEIEPIDISKNRRRSRGDERLPLPSARLRAADDIARWSWSIRYALPLGDPLCKVLCRFDELSETFQFFMIHEASFGFGFCVALSKSVEGNDKNQTVEVNMLHEKLECYRQSVRLAEDLSKEVAKWPRGYGYLADQLRRAMASIVLNIAEGNAKVSHPERRRFFRIARASVAEVGACMDLMRAFGLLTPVEAAAFKSRLEGISKMLWGLMR